MVVQHQKIAFWIAGRRQASAFGVARAMHVATLMAATAQIRLAKMFHFQGSMRQITKWLAGTSVSVQHTYLDKRRLPLSLDKRRLPLSPNLGGLSRANVTPTLTACGLQSTAVPGR